MRNGIGRHGKERKRRAWRPIQADLRNAEDVVPYKKPATAAPAYKAVKPPKQIQHGNTEKIKTENSNMNENTDKKGRTEEQFLQEYDRTKYDRPSFTADNLLFADCGDGLAVLLIRRGGHPYLGQWALPGGFVNPGECAEEAAVRELTEETGISVQTEQLLTVSTPGRDPRGWTVSTCFMGILPEPTPPTAGDDAAEAQWFTVDYIATGDVYKVILRSGDTVISAELKVVRNEAGKVDINRSTVLVNGGIAFDHAKIILYAVESL